MFINKESTLHPSLQLNIYKLIPHPKGGHVAQTRMPLMQ